MPQGRPAKYLDPWKNVRLPNQDSEKATSTSLQIDLHYAKLQIWQRWTFERWCRLANFLNVTEEELASIVCIPHRHLAGLKERNHLFKGNSANHAAALVLTLLEAHVMAHLTQDVIANPFPNLSGAPAATQESKHESIAS